MCAIPLIVRPRLMGGVGFARKAVFRRKLLQGLVLRLAFLGIEFLLEVAGRGFGGAGLDGWREWLVRS